MRTLLLFAVLLKVDLKEPYYEEEESLFPEKSWDARSKEELDKESGVEPKDKI